jgi:hypothetical protein
VSAPSGLPPSRHPHAAWPLLALAVLLAAPLARVPGATRSLRTIVAHLAPASAAAFSFTEEEQRDRDAQHHERAGKRSEGAGLDAACRSELGKHRTVVIIGERTSGGGLRTEQSAYGSHFQVLSRGLRNLGVSTYTQEEIHAQIAQAEVDAYFRNDPDAALGASRKLGADLVLRGTISSRSVFNEFMGLPEVAVTIALALADGSGHVISESSANADSYSGYDTLGMALRLMNERAPGVLATLFRDYCRHHPAAGDS